MARLKELQYFLLEELHFFLFDMFTVLDISSLRKINSVPLSVFCNFIRWVIIAFYVNVSRFHKSVARIWFFQAHFLKCFSIFIFWIRRHSFLFEFLGSNWLCLSLLFQTEFWNFEYFFYFRIISYLGYCQHKLECATTPPLRMWIVISMWCFSWNLIS